MGANNDMQNNPMTYYIDQDGQFSHFNATRYDVDTPVFVKKANMLIRRIGTSSLFSEKLLLAAIATAKQRKKTDLVRSSDIAYFEDLYRKTGTDFSDGLVSEFKNEDIKKLFHIKTSKYYSEIDSLMNNDGFASNWNIMYQDHDLIATTACLTGTAYDKRTGTTYIKWNPDIAEKVLCSKGNGTMLSLELMGQFKDLQSFNTYQLLKEELSYNEYIQTQIRRKPALGEYCTEFDLAEFRFLISTNQVAVKNPDSEHIKKLIRSGRWSEAEQCLEGTDGACYTRWTDFRRYTLMHVSTAINGFKDACFPRGSDEFEGLCREYHPTDIHYRYEEVKDKKKVCGIRFFVRWDNSKEQDGDKESAEDMERHAERLRENIGSWLKMDISRSDMDTLLAAAQGDTDRIRHACDYALSYGREINNLMAFLVDAIKKGYNAPHKLNQTTFAEKISYRKICEIFNPENTLTINQKLSPEEAELVLGILYDLLNPQQPTIKIARMERPSEYVADRMAGLKPEEIGYMFVKIREKAGQGKRLTKNYIMTMLYNAHDEYVVSSYGTLQKGRVGEEYMQRSYSDDDIKAIERKKLGLV